MSDFIDSQLPPPRKNAPRLADHYRVDGHLRVLNDVKEFAEVKGWDIDEPGYTLADIVRRTEAGLTSPRMVLKHGVIGYVRKEDGARRFAQGRHPEARATFTTAIREILHDNLTKPVPNTPIPSPTADWRILRNPNVGTDRFMDALSCATNCVQCALNENDLPLALDWLEEFQNMYSAFMTRKHNAYPWSDPEYEYEELYTLYLKTCLRAATIYRQLGNTACEHETALLGFIRGKGYRFSPKIQGLAQQCRDLVEKFRGVRHPDASTIKSFRITEPKLQVRGVWRRIRIEKDGRPPSRYAFPNCTWRGSFYVFGGLHAMGKHYHDTWKLSLQHPERGWRQIEHPVPPALLANLQYCPAVVYRDCVYIFTGRSCLLVFDLRREVWRPFPTTFAGAEHTWAEPVDGLLRYTAQVIRDKMYVFGGNNSLERKGRNMLLCLDFETARWEALSGSRNLQPNDGTLPGPRLNCISWAVESKFYVAFGAAEQTVEQLPTATTLDYCYRDTWSYDVDERRWRHERLRGNAPCRRTQAACTYNQKWKSAVVFGGVHCTLSYVDKAEPPEETKSWSIVLCKGFPPYRSFMSIISDEETGRTFMFGGYVDTQFTPSGRRAIAQSFNDLWELCVDVPGGGFTDDDLTAWNALDLRLSPLGPWRQCFTCGSIGNWRECLGTCMDTDNGAAFCTETCQDRGWKEHKELNGCRNIGREC